MRTVVFIKNFILSVVLFPIDLIRITLFFLRAHLLLLLGPFIRFLAGRSQNVLKACNQTQPSGYSKTNTQPGCGQTRWFQNKRLYHIVCRNFFILPGSGGRNIGCCAHRGGFHTSFVRSILAGLILGAIWVSLAGGVSLITKRIRITQSAVNSPAMHAAREFERDASTLFSTGEFARARIQYLNAIKKAPGLVSSMWGLARCEMQLDQVDKATRTLKKITQLDSGHVRAHLMLADILLRSDAAEDALERASEARRLAPKSASAHALVGQCERAQGNMSAAQRALDEAVKYDADNVHAIRLAADLALESDDLIEAGHLYDRLLGNDPESVDGHVGLARVKLLEGDASSALEQLYAVQQDNPEHADAVMEVGEALARAGKLTEAKGVYERLCAEIPDNLKARASLAGVLLTEGNFDEALIVGAELLENGPRSPAGNLVLGTIYYAKALPLAAEMHCTKALEKVPQLTAAKKLMARAKMQRGLLGDAIQLWRDLIQDQPDQLNCRLFLAACLIVQNELSNANEVLKAASDAFPESALPLIELGRLHALRGDFRLAAEKYEAALGIAPENRIALNNLAMIYLDSHRGLNQNLDRARTLAEQAIRRSRNTFEIADTLGQAYLKLGRGQDAAQILAHAVLLAPRNPLIRLHLGQALELTGRKNDAAGQLRTALQLSTDFEGADAARELLKSLEN